MTHQNSTTYEERCPVELAVFAVGNYYYYYYYYYYCELELSSQSALAKLLADEAAPPSEQHDRLN